MGKVLPDRSFQRAGGLGAIAIGVGGLGYSAAFVTFLQTGSRAAAEASSLLLMLGGLATVPVFVALYRLLREVDQGVSALALAFGVTAGIGSAIHGAYDLANFLNPPAAVPADLPNAVDPRGLLTFGVAALAILAVSWLVLRSGSLPRRLGYLGVLAGVLLIYVYVGRLTILDPKSPALLAAAVLSGFVVSPAWAVFTGVELLKHPYP